MDELRALRDLASEVHAFNSMSLEASELRDKLSQMKEAGAVEPEAGASRQSAEAGSDVSGVAAVQLSEASASEAATAWSSSALRDWASTSGVIEQQDAASSMLEEASLEEAEELEEGPSSFLVSEPEQRSVDDDTSASTAEPSVDSVAPVSEFIEEVAPQGVEPSRPDTGLSVLQDEAADAASSSNRSPYDAVLDAPRHTSAATTSSSEEVAAADADAMQADTAPMPELVLTPVEMLTEDEAARLAEDEDSTREGLTAEDDDSIPGASAAEEEDSTVALQLLAAGINLPHPDKARHTVPRLVHGNYLLGVERPWERCPRGEKASEYEPTCVRRPPAARTPSL